MQVKFAKEVPEEVRRLESAAARCSQPTERKVCRKQASISREQGEVQRNMQLGKKGFREENRGSSFFFREEFAEDRDTWKVEELKTVRRRFVTTVTRRQQYSGTGAGDTNMTVRCSMLSLLPCVAMASADALCVCLGVQCVCSWLTFVPEVSLKNGSHIVYGGLTREAVY